MMHWSLSDGLFWYALAAAAGMAVLLVVYAIAYVRALKPRAGTLEWIGCYDRPALAIAGGWHGLHPGDVLGILWVSLLAVTARGALTWQTLAAVFAGAGSWLVLAYALLYYLAIPAVTVYCAGVLFKGLFESRLPVLMTLLLLVLDWTAEPILLCISVLSLLFLCRYLTAEAERTFAARLPDLVLTFAVLTVGCYFEPASVVLLMAVLVLLTAGCIIRFAQLGRGQLWASLAAAVVTVAVTVLLMYIPAAFVAGMPFPKLLILRSYHLLIIERLRALFDGLFFWDPHRLVPMPYCWPMLLGGFGAWIAALAGLLRRRDVRGLVLTVWFLALAAIWIFCGVYAMPLAGAACICYVWADLCRRRKNVLMGIGAGCMVLLLLMTYVIL